MGHHRCDGPPGAQGLGGSWCGQVGDPVRKSPPTVTQLLAVGCWYQRKPELQDGGWGGAWLQGHQPGGGPATPSPGQPLSALKALVGHKEAPTGTSSGAARVPQPPSHLQGQARAQGCVGKGLSVRASGSCVSALGLGAKPTLAPCQLQARQPQYGRGAACVPGVWWAQMTGRPPTAPCLWTKCPSLGCVSVAMVQSGWALSGACLLIRVHRAWFPVCSLASHWETHAPRSVRMCLPGRHSRGTGWHLLGRLQADGWAAASDMAYSLPSQSSPHLP